MDDATREGFELTDKDNNEAASDMKKEMDKRFNWLSIGRKMIGIEKVYGGGVIFADIDDGRDPDQRLNENNVRKVNSFQTVERYFAHPFTANDLIGNEKPGQPVHYKISLAGFKNAKTFDVHESRLIRYPSYEADNVLSSRQRQRRITWDVSLIQIMYDTIKKYSIAQQASSALVQGFVMDVMKISNLKEMKDLEGMQAYLRQQWAIRNSMNVNVIGAEDDITRLSTPTTGMDEITRSLRMDVGMAGGIPVPIWFSEESGALGGSTLSESQKVWFSKVSAGQKNKDTPMYRKMLWYVSLEQKWDIENIEFNYNELEYRSAIEQATLEKTDMETATLVFDLGMPEVNILGPKFAGGKQKIGAIDALDVGAFEKDLKNKEQMELDREETENLIREADLKEKIENPTADDKKENIKDAGKSKDNYNVVFEV
jgi:phage-related protein (TIGR01555 family)